MEKKDLLKIVFALFLVTFFAGKINRETAPPPPKGKEVAQPHLTPKKELEGSNVDNAKIMQIISEREYHITKDAQGRLQSPNREQNLRAYYKPGRLTIENRRADAGNHFSLQLINKGIYADGEKLYTPEINAAQEPSSNELKIAHGAFTEEFINTKEGIRQNFVIHRAPKGTKHLAAHLRAEGLEVEDRGNDELRLYANSGGEKRLRLIYNDIHCWDANGKVLESSLGFRDGEIVLDVNAAEADYPVTIDPIIANGNPGNAAATVQGDQSAAGLGCSVSSAGDVNGDGYSDVVAGAYAYDNSEANEGVAFVFHGSAAGISSTPAIILEANQAGAQFGFSVAGAGDVNNDGFSDVVIGAPKYSNVEVEEGAAFVYYGSLSGLSQSSVTVLESGQDNANSGYSVATGGDVNRDGFSDVLVGAPFFDMGEDNEGVIFVYNGSGTGVANVAVSFGQSNFAGGMLGFSVACAGDVNGDGYSDVIAGALGYEDQAVSNTTGAAFIYHGSAIGFSFNKKLWANTDANMGFSVAGAGDVNGDGYSDVVVGANKHREDDGAAYVFHGSAVGVNSTIATTLTIVDSDSQMGNSVACAGDVNGDNFSDIIVGAPKFSDGQSLEGAAFIYQGSLAGVNDVAVSTIQGNQASASMGFSVASAGDVNGDGYSDVFVGAYTYDLGQTTEGCAFVYHGSAASSATAFKITKEMNQADASFGYSVASAGDVNGDGFSDVIVGAPLFDQGEVDEGAVFVFHGSISGLLFVGGSFEGNQQGARMGFSVSCAGDMNGDGFSDVIVGAPVYNNGEANEGAAFIFKGDATGVSFGWWQLILDADQEDARFGYSVAGTSDVNGDGYSDVIVGAILYDHDQIDEGAAFVYYGSSQGIDLSPSEPINHDQSGSIMGYAVNGAGDLNGDGYSDVIVSAPGYTQTQDGEGIVFVYYGSPTGINYNTSQSFVGNQLQANLGSAVSGAGDVNGDGFGDIVIGAVGYFNGELNEGAALIYHGSAAGVGKDPTIILDNNQSDSRMGYAAASAGDVNGDGYSDIIVGAYAYNFGNGEEGVAFVYHGSPTAMDAHAEATIRLNQVGAQFGFAAAGAGDVNGDGYSDVIIGGRHYVNGQNNEGGAFVYLGNQGNAAGTRNNLLLYNPDLVNLIDHSTVAKAEFGIGLREKSFLGRTNAKLVWESGKEGESFSNVPITNSTQFTGQNAGYTDLGTLGIQLMDIVVKQGKATKVRARTKYDPVTAITGQMYSPWRYIVTLSSGGSVNEGTPLPVTLVSFVARAVEKQVDLEWVTSSEIDSKSFEIQRSVDGKSWMTIGEVAARNEANGENRYNFADGQPVSGKNYYRLKMVDIDLSYAFSSIQSVTFDGLAGASVTVYPNPASHQIQIQGNPEGVSALQLVNAAGQIFFESGKFTPELNVEKLPAGTYLLVISYQDGRRESVKIALNKDL
ncbi:FG-GAP-like repeat-containing protein [Dyadobacter fermentans]|uniref:FG-GAP repeat protein n=1 Tax=Dyadobacter fermentans (strain ATCC 700827 / DSM 18053 / CIP 107007 / KCTC 52180 / NS114) TaxID=471854 RepID=C6W1L5_DYAFD|nr:FG-GAP-like repeat-containing protein [Dyadobacter fermentans]ACT93745.1 FG-GAP repeat protein [Dyadobacter fermentans DSM 18053]